MNVGASWRYFALGRDRKPTRSRNDVEYWEGRYLPWDYLTDWTTGSDRSVGLLVERSGLVVLDCDVKDYDGDGYVVRGNRAELVRRRRHGLNDLERVAAEYGERVTPTFTVLTKSGGYHLYYARNQRYPVGSKGHRDGWLIDVKASRNTWVVTPPSSNYSVARDLPVAELPDWLARWVLELGRHTAPLGGDRTRGLIERAAELKLGVLTTVSDGGDGSGGGGGDLFQSWVRTVLTVVSLTNRYGGWNNEIYRAARELFDVDLTVDEVTPLLLEAAAPDDDRERRLALGTINSAWRGHRFGTSWLSGYESEVR